MDPTIDHSALESLPLSAIMAQLHTRLTVNDLGLPEGIYRPDVLANILAATDFTIPRSVTAEADPTSVRSEQEPTPAGELNPSDRHAVIDGETFEPVLESPIAGTSSALVVGSSLNARSARVLAHLGGRALDAAWVAFSYEEGFPCLMDGRPVWGQLEFEPFEAFQSFQVYQAQGREGVRQLFELTEQALVTQDLASLREAFTLYSWDVRVKAYDLFWMTERKRLREMRAMEVDDSQYIMSVQLMEKASIYVNSEEFTDLMTPKTAIDLISLASKMQRIAVGLPAQGPLVDDGKSVPVGAPTEVILRQYIQRQGNVQKPGDDELGGIVDLLDDEENAKMAQELIIKLGEYK